jgi:hypothetical protein
MSALVDAAGVLAGRCVRTASGFQWAWDAVSGAATISNVIPLIHEGAACRPGVVPPISRFPRSDGSPARLGGYVRAPRLSERGSYPYCASNAAQPRNAGNGWVTTKVGIAAR